MCLRVQPAAQVWNHEVIPGTHHLHRTVEVIVPVGFLPTWDLVSRGARLNHCFFTRRNALRFQKIDSRRYRSSPIRNTWTSRANPGATLDNHGRAGGGKTARFSIVPVAEVASTQRGA